MISKRVLIKMKVKSQEKINPYRKEKKIEEKKKILLDEKTDRLHGIDHCEVTTGKVKNDLTEINLP